MLDKYKHVKLPLNQWGFPIRPRPHHHHKCSCGNCTFYKKNPDQLMALNPPNTKQEPLQTGSPRTYNHYTDSHKLEAIQTYLLTGNYALTAKILKINEWTIRDWKNASWWKEGIEELKYQENLKLSHRLKKILTKSFDVIEDRLDKGNFIFDQKTGSLERIPINVRDANQVAKDLSLRLEILEKVKDEKIPEQQVDEKLLKLAEKFAELATKKMENLQKPIIEVTDVVYVKEGES